MINPYNDFISECGKAWHHLKSVAEANSCVPHMLQVVNAARKAGLRVFYALHHRYRPGDYQTRKYIAPNQEAAWAAKAFEEGRWCGAGPRVTGNIQTSPIGPCLPPAGAVDLQRTAKE